MKIGITGLSNSGKTTIFNALTGLKVETTIYATTGGEPNLGTVKVPDSRIDKLSEMFKPKKTTHSTIQYIDYMGLTKGDLKQNRSVFEFVKDADAIVHVVRAFHDDSVAHPLAGVDPVRDFQAVGTELVFADMELVERRLETIRHAEKKGKKQNPDEIKALEKCASVLEGDKHLREAEFTAEEVKAMRHMQFMSIIPQVVVINVDEKDLNTDKAASIEKEISALAGRNSVVVTLSGKVEMEISELPPDEARAFLDDLGIKEPALNKLIHASYGLLGYISFFTVGDDEVRAWPIIKGVEALKAAGKIHSDIERGFIRAEVIGYDDFISAGTMSDAKAKGLFRLEGKTYPVKDGDIINFRFNV